MLNKLFSALFGKFTWTTPPWINHVRAKSVANPKRFWGGSLLGLLALALGWYLYHWYQNLPQPERVTAKITAPKITPNDTVLIPDNLTIDFGVGSAGELSARSVAPLSLVGKEVTDGISLSPSTPGTWTWESDNQLVFTPKNDWPAGQEYTVTFNKKFFAPGTKMAAWRYSFTTLPFEALISSFKFYQDPVNPKLREAVATINFSYPVDTKSLENRIRILWQALKNGLQDFNSDHFKYTVSYDTNKRVAYIHSEPLPLPQTERYLGLILDKGIKPIAGPSETDEPLNAKVLVPDASTYFKISDVNSTIVRNQQDRPDQVLTLETSIGATEAELNKALHVYVLPKDYPETKAEEAKRNYRWQDPGEVTPQILALAKPLALQAIPADKDFTTLHSYKYQIGTPTYLYIKIDKGIKGFGDYTLANDYTAIIKAPDFPQEISFLHKGALLALGSEEKLSVLVRGLGAVKFDIARVLPDDVNHLITQTTGDFSNPYFIDASFNQNNLSEIFSQIQSFDASDPAKEQYTALDLSNYLANKTNTGGPLGLFLLQAHGWDLEKKAPLDVQTSRLILITDLGLVVKDNLDGTHDMFVQSISHGTPVNQAQVALLGKNGVPIVTRTTDIGGHASFPALTDFTNDKEPTVYIVRNGNDVSFIPYNRFDRQLNYSKFDIGGTTNQHDNQAALTAYLFSDRGIYRPGDTAHIGMIIKKPYVLPQPAGLPLEATVVDPRGVTVKDEKMSLNDSGFLTLDFQTNATAQTGQYTINLYIVKDNQPSSLLGSTTLRVNEFLPDRLRITTHLFPEPTQGWVAPDELIAKVGLYNLYGAPAANYRVAGKILLTPQAVTFKEFPEYTFIDPLLNPKAPPKVFTDTLTDTRTDDQGQAEFNLKLNRFEKATYQLTVFAEGFEQEGGRSVTTQTTALVSPLPYFVGYKPDGDLNYTKQNAARSVKLIAINPQLKQQALTDLTLQVFNQRPVTTLVKKEDGTYQYQSIIQSKQVSSASFSINESGTDYALPTQTIGDFLVSIMDKDGTELSHFKYSVVGASQVALPKNAELSVKLNKTEFAPGEDIEMQITAPYTGAGLITIERDKVYAYTWFKTDKTASVQKIRLPADFQGDGYVNIAFVRDLNSSEIFLSPLSFSVMPFAVAHKDREIQLDLTTPKLARPGDTFPITYKTNKAGKIVIYAVDEGILQVSKYTTPDPLQFFFTKHALEVNTQQIVDQILPKFIADRELSSVGGDEGGAALFKNLNPFKRKTEAPVVFWSGILDTDTTAKQVAYTIPDYFNGTLRVMAVAVATDAVGAADTKAEVRGHFVINPNVPTFVAPGDEFEVSTSVANNVEGSGDNAEIKVAITASPQLAIIGNQEQTVTVPQGQERSVHFKVKAKDLLGSAELQFTAKLGDKFSKMTSTLSVRPAIAYSTSIQNGYSTDVTKTLPLERNLYAEYRNVEAAVSPSPLILAVGLQNYLNEYPYGCVEQLVSKAFPLIVMANQPWFTTDVKSINDKVNLTIQMLGQRQMSNGGFNYWPQAGTSSSNEFASVYAMHFLTEARENGYTVPKDVFSAGINYLKELVTQEASSLEQLRLQAYAIYILTRNEIVTTNYLTNLQLELEQNKVAWQTDITSAYMAATYQLLKSSTDANKLIAFYQLNKKLPDSQYDFYNQKLGDAQYIYLLAKHFPEQIQQLNKQAILNLVAGLQNPEDLNTAVSSYSTLALAAYNPYFNVSSDGLIYLTETSQDGQSSNLSSGNNLYQRANLDFGAKQLTINNNDKQLYFYQITQAGFDKTAPTKAINQHIEVYREYRTADDAALSTIKLGDEIQVHIKLRSTDNRYYSNVSIVDLLPGGFEVVRDSINVDNMDYVDAREDRVIFFGTVNPDAKEIVYRIKATNPGKYTVPPLLAVAMYNPLIKSQGIASEIEIKNAD